MPVFSVPVVGESAGTVPKLASLSGSGAASPRQGAAVPVSIRHGATFARRTARTATNHIEIVQGVATPPNA